MKTESSVATLINEQTCPVRIDITDSGFPEGLPALRWHERALAENPWIRRRFGHFALMDAWAQELLCISYGGREHDQLEAYVREYRDHPPTAASLRAERVPQGDGDPAEEMPEHLRQGPLSLAWMTAYELSYDHWLEVIDILADAERVAPGVRNAAVHSLGELLCDDAPPEYPRLRGIGLLKRSRAGQAPRAATPAARVMAGDLRRRAAIGLVRILGLAFDEADADLVANVGSWWQQHRDDPALRIEWSADPKLRYTFLR